MPRFILTLSSLFFLHLASAQQFSFHHYGEKQGISIDQVMRVDQDSDGFLWLGSDMGLHRYDGGDFVNVDVLSSKKTGLGQKVISSVKVTSDSTLTAGMNGDLFVYGQQSFITRKVKATGSPSGPKPEFEKVLLSRDKKTYAITLNCHLYKLHDTVASYFRSFTGITDEGRDPVFRDVISDNRGNLWIATTIGLIHYNLTLNKILRLDFKHYECTRVLLTSKNEVIVSVSGEGLFILKPGSEEFEKLPLIINGQPYTFGRDNTGKNFINLQEDVIGGIWLSNIRQEIFYLQHDRRTFLDYSELYYKAGATYGPEQMFRDRNNDIWMTSRRGLVQVKYSNPTFRTFLYNPRHSFSPQESISVKAFYPMWPGQILISTYQGFYMMDKTRESFTKYKSFVAYQSGGYLPDQPVINQFYKDNSTGKLWLVSETTSLLELVSIDTLKKEIHLKEKFPDALRPLPLFSLFHEKSRQRFLLGGRGLYHYYPSSGKIVQVPVDAGNIYKILPASGNSAFLCTNNGFFLYQDGRVSNYNKELDGEVIFGAEFGASFNDIYLAGSQGIYHIRRKEGEIKQYTTADGLASNYTAAIMRGKNYKLWILTAKGLSVFNPGEKKFKNYSTEDGLTHNDLNLESWLPLPDGSAFLGSINGFNQVDVPPAQLPEKNTYKVFIRNYSVFNGETYRTTTRYLTGSELEQVSIPYEERNLEFNFQALVYNPGSGQQYQYMLDGFDHDWQRSARPIPARYSNLPPGEYTFRVKHSLDGEVWVNCANPLAFIIPPPFYSTWWFLTLLAIAGAGLVYLILRYRLRNAVNMEKMRNRIASDLHDELGGLVTGIALSADLMEFEDSVSRDVQRRKILSLSREAIGKLSDVVWSVNAGNDNFGSLKDRIQESLENLLGNTRFEYEFQVEGIHESTPVPADVRQHLYLICKEAVVNCLKHSDGNRIVLSMTNAPDGFTLLIRDNGTSFSDTRKTGHGLHSIRNRAVQIGGTARIEKNSSGFFIEIKLRKRL